MNTCIYQFFKIHIPETIYLSVHELQKSSGIGTSALDFLNIVVKCILWPTGKRTTREQSKSCRLYSAGAAPENSWVGIRETPPRANVLTLSLFERRGAPFPSATSAVTSAWTPCTSCKSRAPSTSTCGNASSIWYGNQSNEPWEQTVSPPINMYQKFTTSPCSKSSVHFLYLTSEIGLSFSGICVYYGPMAK